MFHNDRLADPAQRNDTVPPRTTSIHGVLQLMTTALHIPYNATLVERSLRQAERDIPATMPGASRQRLIHVAETLGMQVLHRSLTLRQALAQVGPQTPLATFAVSHEGSARWHVLCEQRSGKGRLAPLCAEDADEFLAAEDLARRLGVPSADEVMDWLIPQPATPMTEHHVAETPAEEAHHGPSPLQRLLSLLRPEWRDIGVVVAYAVGIGILGLAVPITASALVNTVSFGTLLQPLIVLCLMLFLALGLASLLRLLQSVVVEYIQRRVFVRLVADLAYRLPRVRLEAFDRQHGPELVNRFFDVLTVQKAGAVLLLDGVAIALQTVISLVVLAFYHQILLGFDVFLLASLGLIVFVLGRGAVRTSIAESKAKYQVAGWIEEMARHPAAFKLHGGPRFALERADLLARGYVEARGQHFRIVLRQFGFALFLQVLASTALLGLGGYLVIAGQLTLGQLVAAELIVTVVVASFTKFGKQLESYYDLLAAVDKLGYLIDLPLEPGTGQEHAWPAHGAQIRIHDVSYRYEGASQPALDQFHLTLAPGERVALLGPNGAGKSTLVDLLFGLRTPQQGYIEIDDMDLRDLRLESLRGHAAIVKEIEIFEGTVLDNLRMGRDAVTTADIRHALQTAALLDEILDLPHGLNTPLGTGGAPLSLGQCQRLMLARALVGQPRLLVLDEVFDDMPPSIRQRVLPAVLSADAPWTLLVVTHSPEVAQHCDRQVRLERGGTRGPTTTTTAVG